MLTLTRKKGEEIVIGEDIVITVREIGSDSVKISVSAPRDVPVFRRELKMAVEESGSGKDGRRRSGAGSPAGKNREFRRQERGRQETKR